MKKLLMLSLVALLVLSVVFTGCAPKPAPATPAPVAADPLKVGFVYIGSANDGGWTQAHDEGRKYMEAQLGDKIKTIYKESVPEASDCEKVITDMIDQGCKVIFTTSFGYMDFTEKVAAAHPDVKFYHCSGYKSSANFVNYFGAMEEPRYLSGIVAGMKTKSNKIGFVAAQEFPEVIRGIDAFALGVQSVNPKAVVKVKFTHTWYDPAKEKEAAKALLDEGCDVLAQHQDSTATQLAAEERGAFAIGYDLNTPTVTPKAYLTAPVWDWGTYYTAQVKSVLDGTWKAENYYGTLKDGMVKLAPLTALAPEGAQAKVDAAKAAIIDGSLQIFKGPITDNTGKVVVAEGAVMTHDELMSMTWLAKGVEGKLSN